jgi:hypothetical protein
VERGHDPETVLVELNQQVNDFNAQVLANDQKCRWETVVTVLAVAGGAVAAWAGFDPAIARYGAVLGGLNNMGIAVLRKSMLPRAEPDAPQRIAAGGAMFHQMDADTGFEFRTIPVNRKDPPQRF